MKYRHRHWFIQNKTIKQELRLDPSGTTYKSSVSARYLSCTTSAKQSSMDSNWTLALWQPPRSSWHRIWGQTMMTRATISATDLIIQLFTLCYPNIPDNNPRRRSKCEQVPRSANKQQISEKLQMVARNLRNLFSLQLLNADLVKKKSLYCWVGYSNMNSGSGLKWTDTWVKIHACP